MGDDYCYLISSTQCLNKGYKFNGFEIYAVSNSYIAGKEIENLNLPDDEHAFKSTVEINPTGGYCHDSIPISGIEQYYKIVGFTNNSAVLFKWKEITSYNNGTPDLIQVFEYEGDVAGLFQNLPDNGIKDETRTDIYPDPNHTHLNIKMCNDYRGLVKIEIFSINGDLLKSFSTDKKDITDVNKYPVSDLSVGSYIVKLKFGEIAEIKKVIIN
jgi:hypothetical protein